ncbi:hypothetical protein IEQ34_023094 [Dendrobium chrysotoxum]|uniref:Uncharacterized protein n=1 Tax=Dendrobium chrysotoxum TaxID=161865 RepID=A0AAV7FKE6_DENCH|nr:hypothetical protein IEQ34_023094 [Dendrobium chrysotoxum]
MVKETLPSMWMGVEKGGGILVESRPMSEECKVYKLQRRSTLFFDQHRDERDVENEDVDCEDSGWLNIHNNDMDQDQDLEWSSLGRATDRGLLDPKVSENQMDSNFQEIFQPAIGNRNPNRPAEKQDRDIV